MEKKLFIVGIGGTGARVIKALTFLLASGVEINTTKIFPIIIDVDLNNDDSQRTIEILKNYQRIRNKINNSGSGFEKNNFFKTAIETVPEWDGFKFSLREIGGHRTFKDFIGYENMGLNNPNKYLIDGLFSKNNLEITLENGFEGNPNMGSIGLNQFEDSAGFRQLAAEFREGDRIFIVSSIFGGTGAAGFPLFLKNIRGANANIPNNDHLRKAKIGAIAVLPYFGVLPDENSSIDSNTFIAKTKAALAYYKDNINRSVDTLYYISDKKSNNYQNHPGGVTQKNDAHFVELASALAAINFMSIEDNDFSNDTIYKEFGIKHNPELDNINFTHLGNDTEKLIKKPLIQYQCFNLFLSKGKLDESIKKPNPDDFCVKGKVKLDSGFLDKPFYRDHITQFNERFTEWLEELARNTVAFTPFKSIGEKNFFYLLNGIDPKKSFFGKDNYNLFIECLNEAETQVTGSSIEEKFIAMFHIATDKMINKKFGV